MRLDDFIWNVSSSLSYDCKIPNYGIDRFRIFAKLVEAHTSCVIDNLINRFHNIGNSKFPASMRHEQPRSEYLSGWIAVTILQYRWNVSD